MYKILDSFCGAFKNDEELNQVIEKYLELRAKDRFDAIDFVKPFRKQMNTEGKNDLQEILDKEADKLGI